MSTARYVLIALSAWPVGGGLAAQATTPRPPWVRSPDVAWIAPLVAQADAQTQAALARIGPAMARAQGDMVRAQAQMGPALARAQGGMVRAQAQMGPALARAQAGMIRAQAALAGAPWSD